MPRIPGYLKHATSGQARVIINGKAHYLGPYGSPESRREYERILAEHLTTKNAPTVVGDDEPLLTVAEVWRAFWEYGREYYGDHPRSTMHNYGHAMNPVLEMYGDRPAESFRSLELLAIQQWMIDHGRSRTTVNMHSSRLKKVWRWAASRQLVPDAVYQSLSTVEGIGKGRTKAKEARKVPPVPDDVVQATLEHLTPVLQSMVMVQRHTGARPGEICRIRPMDIDRSGDVWLYRPSFHKTEHHGHERVIAIGPKAQDWLRPYLLRDAALPCFSPHESERQRLDAMRANRRTPLKYGNRPTGKLRPDLRPFYDANSYRKAIQRVCKRHDIEMWSPHQLRHTRATELRAEAGIDAAQQVLGHTSPAVTLSYAERSLRVATEAARRSG